MSTPKHILNEDALRSDFSGQRRFALRGAGNFWLIDSGYADLFSVTLDGDGEPNGALQHLHRFEAGEALFGIEADAAPSLALMVSAGPQTKLSWSSFAARGENTWSSVSDRDLIQILHRWIVTVSTVVGGQVAPKKSRTIAPEETLSTADDPEVIVPADEVSWVSHTAGFSRLLGMSELTVAQNSPPYPITRFCWIEAQPESTLAAADPLRLVETGEILEGLKSFHSQAVACLADALARTEQKERDRLQRRADADLRGLRAAVSELASPLGRLQGEAEAGLHAIDSPLFQACDAIGKAVGIEFKPYAEMLQGKTVREPVETLARTSGIRTRVVALKGEWWRIGGQPMLAFAKDDKRPIALIPQGSRGCFLYDPTQRVRVRFKPDAIELNPFAYTFYRPFPRKALTARDLIAFSLAGCRPEALRILLMGIASGLLATLTPVATGVIFDSLIPGALRSELLLICSFLVTAAFASTMFTLTRGFAVLRIQNRMSSATQSAVWDRLLTLPLSFFRDYAAGDLATRSMAVEQMRQVLTGNTLSSILSGIFSIFSFGLLFYYSARLALMFTAFTVLASAVTITIGYRQLSLQRQSWAQSGSISGMVLEFITGIAKLRVAGAEQRAFALWVRQFAQQKKTDFAASKLSNTLTVFNSVFPVFTLASIFLSYAYIRSDATVAPLSTGDFLAFVTASTQFLAGVLALSSSTVALLAIVPLYERAAPILQMLPETDIKKTEPGPLAGSVEAAHLVFRYKPDSPVVLRDISFTIAPGEYVAFVGPSGCGKSTLFRMLLGFEQPESGAIYYDGQDLTGLDLQAVRRQMGVVLQSGSLVHGTILENIRGTNGSVTVDDAWAAIRLAGLEDDVRRLPMGIHTYIREGGGGLSGGQRQRILIARAIVGKPNILLFDEATSALDNQTQAIVSSSLSALKSTRIVIAHRLSTIVDADRIIVMERGRIVQQGPYHELMNQAGLFRELASRQLV